MANILSSLHSTADALEAYSRVLDVTQNNVANASTPGYAKQTQLLQALPFDPANGLLGGVRAGEVQSARNQFAEQAVRRQTTLLGQAQQDVNSLTSLESYFDVSGNSGIPKALNALFQSFSAWGQTPTSMAARADVLQRAADVARSFQQTAAGLMGAAQETRLQIGQTVAQINELASQVAKLNAQVMAGARGDAGLDARTSATLEALSQYADVSAAIQEDGSVTVLLNGQTPLVIGDRTYALAAGEVGPPANATYPDAPPSMQVRTADGADITRSITGGQLGALLDLAHQVLPGYLGSGDSPGDLNRMARQFADAVNGYLSAGYVSAGPPPQAGVPLFTYDAGNPTSVAASLAVEQGITADQLAAIAPGPPQVGNGVALELAQMADPQLDAAKIDGQSYSEFFGVLAARVGNRLNGASSALEGQQSALAQAQNLRQQMSGVSLDEEATILVQFQRAYEANSRLITVLDQLSQDIINMIT